MIGIEAEQLATREEELAAARPMHFERHDSKLEHMHRQWSFTLRAKQTSYGERSRVEYTVAKVAAVDRKARAKDRTARVRRVLRCSLSSRGGAKKDQERDPRGFLRGGSS